MKIFVTVGTHPQQFNRLLKEIDRLVAEKRVSVDVFAQTGNSDFEPMGFGFTKFLPPEEMRKRISESSIVISHAGAGSIISALEQKKPLIVVPRLQSFGEHTNDHQRDLAVEMEKSGKAIAVLEIKGLEKAIAKAKSFKPAASKGPEGIIAAIEQLIEKGVQE